MPQLRGLSHGDEAVVGFDALVGSGVEAHGVLALDGENDHTALLADAGTLQSFAREGRIGSDVDLADFEVHSEMGRGGVKKADHVRAQQRLRDALPRKGIRRDDGIGPGRQQVFVRHLFARSGNNAQPRVHRSQSTQSAASV